ncbi:hypothetical protein IKF26_02060, partial [Candidatus Saccharibacteria bacterium]|nr:hypothetical protein [Candidatus Saccharibacteria bacterium]
PGSTISSPYRPTIIGETQGDTEDFTNYHVVPTTYTKVATLGSTTDRTIGSAIQSTYAIYIKSTQPVGLYTGQVKYTLVHPASAEPNMPKDCSANKICYFPNGNGFVTDTMADQSVGSTATSITLWPTNFKRQGYGFAGWSDKYDWVLNENDANGNGTGANAGYHIYGPMQTIEFTAGQYTTKGLSLYAVWAPSAGDIQDWICPNNTTMPIGTVTALTDKRDNDTYAVAKLADSNCWMIENLRLDYDAEHNADGSLAQGYGTSTTYGNFSGLARPETANFTADNSSATAATPDNSLYYADTKSSGSTATIDITQTSYAGYRMPRYRNDNTNTDATVNPNTTTDNMTGVNQNIYSYGNYYTWAAAIADTAYYSTSNKSVTTTSLCPTGWRLPKGGTKTRIEQPYDDNEFWNLVVDGLNNGTLPSNYSSSARPYYDGDNEAGPVSKLVRSFPNNFLYSGYVLTTSMNLRATGGLYWSSTTDGATGSFILYFRNSFVRPGVNSYNKYYGASVRCMVGS